MNKKGAAEHLEIIIAFILFTGFVFFMLYFIKMPKQNTLAESSLSILQANFERENYINLTKISASLNYSGNCISIDLNGMDGDAKSIAKSSIGEIMKSKFSQPTIKIEAGQRFVYLYLCSEFTGQDYSPTGCISLPASNFSIGAIEKSEVLAYSLLNGFAERYEDDYSNLKSDLGVPQNLEFSIKINDPLFSIKLNSAGQEVTSAKTTSYPIVYPDGNIAIREVTFSVW